MYKFHQIMKDTMFYCLLGYSMRWQSKIRVDNFELHCIHQKKKWKFLLDGFVSFHYNIHIDSAFKALLQSSGYVGNCLIFHSVSCTKTCFSCHLLLLCYFSKMILYWSMRIEQQRGVFFLIKPVKVMYVCFWHAG